MMFSTRIMTAQLRSVEGAAARRHSIWRTCCQQQDELGGRASERRTLRGIAPADALLQSLAGAALPCIAHAHNHQACDILLHRTTQRQCLVVADIAQQSGVERATTSIVKKDKKGTRTGYLPLGVAKQACSCAILPHDFVILSRQTSLILPSCSPCSQQPCSGPCCLCCPVQMRRSNRPVKCAWEDSACWCCCAMSLGPDGAWV